MYKLIMLTLFLTHSYADCIICHKTNLSEIHNMPSMTNEIKKLADAIKQPSCTICHGGDAKAVMKEEAHKGAPLNHPGSLAVFAKDPSSDETIESVCAMCHEPSSL